MKWKHVKSLMLVLLLAVNVFFIYNIIHQYNVSYRIDETALENTVGILKESGIYIEKDVVPKEKMTEKVHEFLYDDDYFSMLTERLCGNGSYTAYTIPDGGVKYVMDDSGDVVEFTYPFGLYYASSGDKGVQYISDYMAACDTKNMETVSGGVYKSLFYEALSKLLPMSTGEEGDSDDKVILYIKNAFHDTEKDRYIVSLGEKMNGMEINGCDMICAVEDGKLIYADGNMILSQPSADYSASLCDQLTVLFYERKYYTEKEPIEESEVKIITVMNSLYCVTWNSAMKNYYLIPAWNIEYIDGIVNIRNAINGDLYTE